MAPKRRFPIKPKLKAAVPEPEHQDLVVKTLPLGEFTTIVHLSDVHIRPKQRHDEFIGVFNETYRAINGIDGEKLIVITGDLYDSHTTLKPETVRVSRSFLKNLAAIAPVVLIGGNHDMKEGSNKMDVPFAVCGDIPNVHYLRFSGVYNSEKTEHTFVVSSLADAKFIRREDIEEPSDGTVRKYVALYHGVLQGTDTGEQYELRDDEFDTERPGTTRYRRLNCFDGFDAVLLGDIHQQQVLQEDPCIAYAGSLIQQRHSEALRGHGMLVWDAGSLRSPKFVEIPNEYGFITFDCEEGVWDTDVPDEEWPKYAYVRINAYNCTESQVDKTQKEIKQQLIDIRGDESTVVNWRIVQHAKYLDKAEVSLEETRIVDEHTVVKTHAEQLQFEVEPLLRLHEGYQQQLREDDLDRGTDQACEVWRPLKLEFQNVFGYGGDHVNRVDFGLGVTCISAKNTHGKTSLVNALLFALFGAVPDNDDRRRLTTNILHNTKTKGYVRVLIEHGAQHYLIERKAGKANSKTSKKATLVDQYLHSCSFSCDVWRSNDDGECLEKLNDVKRRNNDTVIESLIGKLDDFLLCNLVDSRRSTDLLTKTPTDKVNCLRKIFGIDRYVQYRDYNKAVITETKKMLAEQKSLLNGVEAAMPNPPVEEESVEKQRNTVDELTAEVDRLKDAQDHVMERVTDIKISLAELNRDIDPDCTTVDGLEPEDTLRARLAELDNPPAPEMTESQVRLELRRLTAERGALQGDLPVDTVTTVAELQKQAAELPVVNPELTYASVVSGKARLEDRINRGRELPRPKKYKPGTDYARLTEEAYAKATAHDPVTFEDAERRLKTLKKLTEDGVQPYDVADLQREIDEVRDARREASAVLRDNPLPPGAVSRYEKKWPAETLDALEERIARLEAVEAEHANLLSGADEIHAALTAEVEHMTAEDSEASGLAAVPHALVPDRVYRSVVNHLKPEQKSAKLSELTAWHATLLLREYEAQLAELNVDLKNSQLFAEAERYQQAYRDWKKYNELRMCQEYAETQAELVQMEDELAPLCDQLAALDLHKQLEEAERYEKTRTRIDEITVRLEELNGELDGIRVYDEFTSVEDALDTYAQYRKQQTAVARQRSYLAELKAVEEEEVGLREQHATVSSRLTAAVKRLTELEYKLVQQTRLNEAACSYREDVERIERELIPLNQYAELMSATGIEGKLLYDRVQQLQEYINNFITQFTKYSVQILYDGKKGTINVMVQNNETQESLKVSRLSGYESLIVQLSFKRALNKFSFNAKSAIMLIDEALDCIDQDNFETKMPNAISLVNQDYRSSLVISQRDIRHISDREIRINRINGCSVLVA